MTQKQSKTLAALVLGATLTFALSPLATIGFNGFTPAQFPIPQIDPPVQPSGYAFSIWGVIYLWLIAGAAYGVWRAPDSQDWHPMRPWLAVSLVIGTFWIAVANVSPHWATVMIIAMAVTAIFAMLRAGPNDPWLKGRPVALYAGWLTAATGVAIGVLLGGYGLLSAQTAAILCLAGVLAVAASVQAARPREWGYPVAVIWALIWVVVANLSGPNWVVISLASVGIAGLGLRMVRPFLKDANA
ncbi:MULTISPECIES: TspO/MBR family protein [Falsihalocynthiibacter]|uniref:TspO/MBR family protein n=1 Tax=Falsihalocynthiibacter TaxID=2854182 RepID=UPI00300243EE